MQHSVKRDPADRRPAAIDRPLVVLVFGVAFLIGAGFVALEAAQRGNQFLSQPNGRLLHDFAFFWGGARLTLLGRVAEVFDPTRFNPWLVTQIAPGTMQDFATWSYPPTMLLAMLPFGALPLPIAYFAWLAATFAALVLALRVAVADWRIAGATIASPAALYAVQYGRTAR